MTAVPAVVVVGPGGLAAARRVAAALGGAPIHAPRGVGDGAVVAYAAVADHLRVLYAGGAPIVGVCAAGILIRALAPRIADKRSEPPVVAVAEDGSAVVPLLGGHRGANELARRVAAALGGVAAITTAGDLRFGVALDAPPPGWRLADPEAAKAATAALLGGARARLVVEAGNADWLLAGRLPLDPEGSVVLRVSDRAPFGSGSDLVYHPPVLAVGVGCERGAEPEELVDLVAAALAEAGLAAGAVAVVASLDLKTDEAAVHAAAAALDVPARFFAAAALEAERPRLANPSAEVFAEVGCHGVAEGAALAAVGAEGELVVAKRKSARATCAVARAPAPIAADEVGRARGALAVVGLGPGAAAWRTPEAEAALAQAEDVVGYGLYLDLLGPAPAGQRRHAYALGEEEARVRRALDLAAEGRRVALVSSGDAGIYAMASLVFELLDDAARPDWRRIAIEVLPGLSAMQAAAARVGAPLGHDFCAVSLSDLMTPWPEIERRLRAAAAADFVVALYNPASARRGRQLGRARDILLTGRPGDTPAVVARNLGRSGERVTVVPLSELDAADVDMLTIVLVGSSATRSLRRGGGVSVYTPRGYGREGTR